MCFISKSPCCNTSTPGVRDPFTFLALQRFDEVDRGWDGYVENAVRSIFCTYLRKTTEMQKRRALLRSSNPEVFGEQGLVVPRGLGGLLCARLDFLTPARSLAVSGERTQFALLNAHSKAQLMFFGSRSPASQIPFSLCLLTGAPYSCDFFGLCSGTGAGCGTDKMFAKLFSPIHPCWDALNHARTQLSPTASTGCPGGPGAWWGLDVPRVGMSAHITSYEPPLSFCFQSWRTTWIWMMPLQTSSF